MLKLEQCNMLEVNNIPFYKDTNLLFKRIPHTNKLHILDPTVIEKVKKSSFILETDISQDNQSIDALALRQTMGSPNNDITSTPIKIETLLIPLKDRQIPIRIFKPNTPTNHMIIFIHGGGYIGGSSCVSTNPCKYLCECAQAMVVSIDYRLAPEAPFPAAYNDCKEVTEWLLGHLELWQIDSKHVAICGESAGGALALAISATELGKSIALTIPIYAALDVNNKKQLNYWSYDHYPVIETQKDYMKTRLNRFILLNDLMVHLYAYHVHDYCDERLSPLYTKHLQNISHVLLIEAEYDYYRLSNDQFAKRLIDHHIPCTLVRYQGMDHGFFDRIGNCMQTKDCIETIALYFQQLL